MNKKFGIAIIIAMMSILAVSGCKKSAPAVDVVNGVTQVSDSMSGVRVTMEQLAQLPATERAARLNKDWPHLSEDVTYYAKVNGLIPRSATVNHVDFLFGSLKNVRAGDHNGVQHTGYANNQLVARIHLEGQAPIDLFVLCFNGMVAAPKDMEDLQLLGSAMPIEQFTIGRRQGLVPYVDYPVAISLAEKFHLPLYQGRQQTAGRLISPEQARQMEPNTARVQITVKVYPGDRFDLAAGTYSPAVRPSAHARHKALHKTGNKQNKRSHKVRRVRK